MMITAVVKRDLGSGNDLEETLMMAVNEVKIEIVETMLQKSGNAEPDMLIRIRHDICHNRCNQRLRKIFEDCVNFSANNANYQKNFSQSA